MTSVSSYMEYPFVISVLFFASSVWSNGIQGFQNQQHLLENKLVVISHESCQSCPDEENLKDVHTYSQLKNDPRASLPSSFTICGSVILTTFSLNPSFFTLLGNNGQPWVSAQIRQNGNFIGRQFFYPVPNQWAKIDTMRMFPNQWVRSCLAFNTLSGFIQWVVQGELVDNSTVTGITNNIPTDLSGKVILGSFYTTCLCVKWVLF